MEKTASNVYIPGVSETKGVVRSNLHIYPSPFRYETRMLKETKSIADAGLFGDIYIAAMWEEGLPKHEHIDDKRQVWRIRPRIGSQRSSMAVKILRYIEWQIRILLLFRSKSIRVVNCHSLPVLPLGLLFKMLRARVVYDTHELETETAGSAGLRRFLSRLAERVSIPFVDAVITVNESISEWYRREYGLKNVTTVRNVPYRHAAGSGEPNILKRRFGIPGDEVLFIYQGAFGEGRGIGILLDVFAQPDSKKHIVFMGFGEWEGIIKERAKEHRNIHFLEAVRPEEVRRYTGSADVGIYPMENICLNHFLSLPNKVFEYIMSGLPVILSDFPEMKRIVAEANCGWTVPVDKNAVLALVSAVTWEEIREKRKNAREYSRTIGWDKEEPALLQVYRTIEPCVR